ncbi:MAG TPA: STAS domain-containing protein [Candidatus Limnocylindrales bacterium]|jgi:anti-anti-sigma regulatory factor|nr:STAS domain-containing protein [Candidatus Limnocylindrales bacterium]
MSTPSASMSVLVGDQFACVKIIGRANFSSSIDFKTLLNELKQKGYSYFVLDLSGCSLMDSTFLGVLAGFGLKMMTNDKEPPEPAIELLNPNARIIDLLESLGVLHLFKVTQGPVAIPETAESRTHEPVCATKAEVTRACLEAHRTLMEINPGNVSKFKDLAKFLAEDLKKTKPSS